MPRWCWCKAWRCFWSAPAIWPARLSGSGEIWLFVPLLAGLALFALDRLPGRVEATLAFLAIALAGSWLAESAQGIAWLFAVLLVAGGVVIAAGGLHREDRRPGYYPMLAVLLISIPALLRSSTSLEFFFSWEIITLASCFLIAKGKAGSETACAYLPAVRILARDSCEKPASTFSHPALRVSGPASRLFGIVCTVLRC